MLLMSASAHFSSTADMVLMLPAWVPMRELLVFVTGFWEIALAAALWVPGWNRRVGLVVAMTLVVFLPANIYAAAFSVPFGGHVLGPAYLLIRVPFQVFLFGLDPLGDGLAFKPTCIGGSRAARCVALAVR